MPITRRERFTLLAVRSVFDVLRGTPLLADINSVLAKLEQRMSKEERTEQAALPERFAYVPDGGTKAYDEKEDIIDALQTGILSRKVVKYVYKDSRGRLQRTHLAPFAMLLYRHGLYVVGCRLAEPSNTIDAANWRRTFGVFAVERFTDADHLRERSFEVPSDFKLAGILHGAFGIHLGDPEDAQQVVVEFSKDRAHYARNRIWHYSQQLEELADGRVRLAFTCTNLSPVVSWILEWGPHARVVAPLELVQLVKNELDEARRNYA